MVFGRPLGLDCVTFCRRVSEEDSGGECHVNSERYEIRVSGRLGETTLAAFRELGAEIRPIETVLFGELPDQAALYGVLDRIQALGLQLVELRRLPRL